MNTFWEFCSGYFRPRQPEVVPPVSQRPYLCANMLCISETMDTSEWRKAILQKRVYYFCTSDCWEEWLASPSYIGCYSPVIQADAESKIPPLDLAEMVQPSET